MKPWHLNPFRRAAFDFVREASRGRPKSRRREQKDPSPFIVDALTRIRERLATAGHGVPANNLRAMLPEDKARAVWARLRDRNVDPVIILAIALGVHAALAVDPNAPRWEGARRDWFKEFAEGPAIEYALVQMAKLLNTLGGGTVKRWVRTSKPDKPTVIDARSVSAGRVLRHLGADLWRDARMAAQHHVADVLALKAEMSTPLTKLGKERVKSKLSRPYPKTMSGVRWQDRAAILTIIDDGPPQGHADRAPKSVEVVEPKRGVQFEIRRY